MYTNVLAAINEHLNSEIAARYALHFARACGSRLTLCFIAGKDLPGPAFERAEGAMERLFIEAENLGITVESRTGTGDPVTEIGKIVRRETVSIVFTATRRKDTEKRFFAGTVARRLSLKLPCSVALVRVVHMGKIRPGTILVPLKARINRIGERAYFTMKIAEAFEAAVFPFHAPRPLTKFLHGELHLTPLQWSKRVPPDILRFAELMDQYGIRHERRLAPGSTGRGITIEAAARRHDLIIMGASERSLWSSLLRGNPVEEVLRETPCDLIILTPRRED